MPHPLLNEPITLARSRLTNRVMLAPMTRVSAQRDGTVNQRIERYYRKFAEGGFAALITEGLYIDETYSPGYVNQPGICTPDHESSWRTVTDSVHEAGSLIIAQLMHAGPQTQGNVFGYSALGPSQ